MRMHSPYTTSAYINQQWAGSLDLTHLANEGLRHSSVSFSIPLEKKFCYPIYSVILISAPWQRTRLLVLDARTAQRYQLSVVR